MGSPGAATLSGIPSSNMPGFSNAVSNQAQQPVPLPQYPSQPSYNYSPNYSGYSGYGGFPMGGVSGGFGYNLLPNLLSGLGRLLMPGYTGYGAYSNYNQPSPMPYQPQIQYNPQFSRGSYQPPSQNQIQVPSSGPAYAPPSVPSPPSQQPLTNLTQQQAQTMANQMNGFGPVSTGAAAFQNPDGSWSVAQ